MDDLILLREDQLDKLDKEQLTAELKRIVTMITRISEYTKLVYKAVGRLPDVSTKPS